uniref:Transmembrane protein 50A n=1 Tax=Spongospora subterranea TaxID=70186 RepID=A0A0H5R5P0_9EUKA|eukprot:CRZ09448.1 hypothetical protein [Spongospora subterranea]
MSNGGGKIQAMCGTAGALCGLGWWLFIDGASYGASISQPILWYFALPGIMSTLAAIILIGIDFESLRGSVFGGVEVTQARFWFLVSVAIFTGSLILGMFVLITKYSGAENAEIVSWPGISIVLQSFLIYISAILLSAGRNIYGSS